jgi:uncharacterized protein (TIGR02599 family)
MKGRFRMAAFTLTEALVSSSVIALVLGVMLGMTDQTQRLMRGTSSKVEQFQDARLAFETVTRRLSQATLNTYLDYRYKTVSQNVGGKPVQVRVPSRYERASDLRFRSGPMAGLNAAPPNAFQATHGVFFQAPNGYVENTVEHGSLDHLLNTWGYFVELGTDEEFLPECLKGKITAKKRFRLMELTEPAEHLRVYQFQQPQGVQWFKPLIGGTHRPVRAIAENVVALVLLPRLAQADEEMQLRNGKSKVLAPDYVYDTTQSRADANINSKHQLPPVMQVVMVAIDEPSAAKLDKDYRNQSRLGLDYGNLFTNPELLEDDPSTKVPNDGDIAKFTEMLRDRLHVSSRVFSTNVSIRGAKWSRSQEN